MKEKETLKEIPSWTELDSEQKAAVLALTVSQTVNGAARRFKTDTGRSRAYFYSRVYPVVRPYWQSLSNGLSEEALRILKGGSLAAAHELVEEIGNKDVRIRNKASNDVLGHVLPKQSNYTGFSVKDGDREVKLIIEDYT